MQKAISLSRVARRQGILAGAATVVGLFGSTAARGAFTYTNVDAAAATTAGTATYTSRGLSINDSGEVQGYYQTTSSTSSRAYFTYPAGSTGVTPYASGLAYTATGSSGGAAVGQILNAGGTYLATSTAATPNPGGSYNPLSAAFTPFPLNATYNGTYTYTAPNGLTYTQTQSASQFLPIAINAGGTAVGNQTFALTNATNANAAAQHGVIYNAATSTTTDIGGNPAGITYSTPFNGNSVALQNAAGASSLVGISSNNTVVVGSQGNAVANFGGTPTDAIYGAENLVTRAYAFSDLASMIAALVPTGDTYNSSNATAVSENGRYVVGNYQYTIGTGTTKYTHAFELTNDSSVADLGYLSTANNAYTNVLDAESVNDSGTVVGYGYLTSSVINAFQYSGGQLTNLNSIAPTPVGSGVYTEAYGIDDSGDITGYTVVPTGTGSTTSSVGNAAFLLTSVPEPASGGLVFVVGGLAMVRRRRRLRSDEGASA